MSTAAHWESIYARRQVHQVSWFRPHLDQSLASVDTLQLPKDARLIDVGAGASTLVDDLLDRGFTRLTVADLSSKALEVTKQRLGERAAQVDWRVGDVTTLELPAHAYDFWHDRAVFHFLRDPADRARYVAQVKRAVRPGGHVLVATFGPHGPQRCSDLDTMRYSGDELHAQFGGQFQKVDEVIELHPTPSGQQQEFLYCLCRLSG